MIPSGRLASRVTQRSALETLDAWSDWSTRIGEELFDLEAQPSTALLDTGTEYAGATADAIGDAAEDNAQLWAVWSAVKARLQTMRDMVNDGKVVEASALFDDPVDGVTRRFPTLGSAADWVEKAVRRVDRTVDDLAAALVESGGHVAAARQAMTRIEQRAAELGVRADRSIVNAGRVLVNSEAVAAADPMSFNATTLEVAVRKARDRIEQAEDERDQVDARLHDAVELISELQRLIPAGAVALNKTLNKIAGAEGLLQPLDGAEVLEEPRTGLRAWLERIQEASDSGDIRATLAGLERWETVANAHLKNARKVLAANRAPLDRRDELRGLLDALRARAASKGLAEDPTATALHREVRDLLYVAPCPIARAEKRFEAYRAYVLEGRT